MRVLWQNWRSFAYWVFSSWFMHQNSCFEKENHLISVWGHSFTLGRPFTTEKIICRPLAAHKLPLPKRKRDKVWFELSYCEAVCSWLSVSLSLCDPAHYSMKKKMFTHFMSIYDPAHYSMKKIICLPTLWH